MPNTIILGHLGFFVRRGFLGAEICRRIRGEMAAAARVPAMVRPLGQASGVVDPMTRRTGVASVPPSITATLEDELRAIQPALEQHFRVQLTGWQRPRFYIYEEGDFFTAHRDSDVDPAAPDWIKARQVSISVFLNDTRDGHDGESYSGGEMIFHGSRSDENGAGFALPVDSETGMLVAFRSDWIHEVRPITNGRRYSIVTWFF